MKIPEHDIIDVKWLLARASYSAKPREEEARAAAEELFSALVELDGLHGVSIKRERDVVRVGVPGGVEPVIRYADGEIFVTRAKKEERAPIAYDAGLKSFIGPEISEALPGRNGQRPRVAALVALMRAALGDSAEVVSVQSRPISLRGG